MICSESKRRYTRNNNPVKNNPAKLSRLPLFTLILTVVAALVFIHPLSGQEGDREGMRGLGISETNFSGAVGSGARALGMGGAFIAVADDATAVSWNPAGLAQLEKPELSLVFRYQTYHNMIPARFAEGRDFFGAMDFKGTSESFDFASFTYPIRIGNFKIVPQISYQRAISFDMVNNEKNVQVFSSFTDQNVPFEFNAEQTHLQKLTGGLDTVSFSLATTLFSRFHVGVSANVWVNGFYQDEILTELWDVSNSNTGISWGSGEMIMNFTQDFKMSGFNINAGLLVNVLDNLKVGFVYKSGFSATIDYTVGFSASGQHPFFGPAPHREFSGKTKLHWPETKGIGIAYMPTDRLTISFDLTSTQWSESKLERFSSVIEGEPDQPGGDLYFPTLLAIDNEAGIKQMDTLQLRGGLEYIFINKKTLIPVRLGFFADSQYYPDAIGDKIMFFGITSGVGIKKGRLAVDAAIQYEFGSYIESSSHYADSQFGELRLYLSTIYSF